VKGKGEKGRLKKRWLNVVETDIKRPGVSVEEAEDLVKWFMKTWVVDHNYWE